MTDAIQTRHVPDRLNSRAARIFKSWEALLLAVAIAIFVINSFASPYFLNAWNLSDATFNFTEKAMIAFAMALLIISGEIDLSVASIIALGQYGDGSGAAIRGRHAGACRRRPDCRLALRGVQRVLCHRAGPAVHRGDHRHHEPVPRHQFHHPWR